MVQSWCGPAPSASHYHSPSRRRWCQPADLARRPRYGLPPACGGRNACLAGKDNVLSRLGKPPLGSGAKRGAGRGGAYWDELAAKPVTPLRVEDPNGSDMRIHSRQITIQLDPQRTRALLHDVPMAYRTRINDVLLAALGQAVCDWNGSQDVLTDVEGHGREEIFPNVDVTRTVGWFTSIYPVLLTVGEADPGRLLKSIKEQLRAVPGNGFWYGIKRYLTPANTPQIKASILFNYLGQLDQALSPKSAFAPGRGSSGTGLSPAGRSRHEWEIIGDVTQDCLRIHWRYSGQRYSDATIQAIADACKSELEALIDHCRSAEAGGFTPSDFPMSSLAQRDLDRLITDPRNVEDLYPLAPIQHGLLLHTLLNPHSGIYLMQDVIDLKGKLDVSAFQGAWQQVVEAHSILRTAFYWTTDKPPHQIVFKSVDMPCELFDWRDLDEHERQDRLRVMLEAELTAGLKLDQAPILRMRLIHVGEDRWVFARSHHHILLDAWCLPLLLADFLYYYEALLAGGALPTRAATPYRGYLSWLRRQDFVAAEHYWRKVLKDFTTPTYMVAQRNPRELLPGELEVADAEADLSEGDTVALHEACRKHRLTPSAFLQGAWALLMAHYLNRQELLFGVTVAGRPAELDRVEEMAGLFINTLPFRTTVDPTAPLLDWLHALLSQTAEMRQYEYASLAEIQKWSDIERGQQLFDSFIVFENVPINPTLMRENLPLEVLNYSSRTHSNYPLNLSIRPHEALCFKLTYDRRFFDTATAERMLAHYLRLLQGMIHRPEARLEELGLLASLERIELLEDWNRTGHVYGEPRDLIGRFEAQVLESPEAVASSCGSVTLSYQALNEKANRLAHALIGEGVGPDTVVALLDERGLDFLAMMLAIFKAGAAYLPLDPAHPDGRIAQVLVESQVGLLLAGTSCRDRAGTIVAAMADLKPRLLDLATLEARESCRENPRRRHGPKNLAFVIYTSGSTGKPKGAMVEHQGMFNNLITKVPALELTSADVIAQTASQCFDISVWQFLTALTLGARVEIFPDAISRDPQRLLEEIAARGVTILEAVPSMIRALLDAPEAEAGLAGLRWLLPCGEAFAPELCRRFMERHPRVRLLNAYGPAECSDDVSYYPIEAAPAGNDLSVPIGRPVDNTRLYLLNRWLEPAPVGAPGEICVGGVQVGRGYLNRPDLTAAAFRPDPFGPPGTRLYHTGDLGRYRADGVIEFLGRVDHQVKIRGHRIEPGEVEACLATHPGVQATAVVARLAAPGIYRLVAYVVGEVDADALRQHLRATLPDYMIPAAFVSLEALPLTPNGKVDRNALPEPDLGAQLAQRFVAPRTPTEEILAQIWADVLRVERVGINDNFFELGGHSLLATRIASRIRSAFEIDLPLRTLFEASTLAALAPCVDGIRARSRTKEGTSLVTAPREKPLPASHAQQRLWFMHQMDGANPLYHFTVAVRVTGPLDAALFEASLNAIIQRHESLRTVFWMDAGHLHQNILPDLGIALHYESIEDGAGVPANELLRRIRNSIAAPFDLACGPLVRASVYRLAPPREPAPPVCTVLLCFHHIVFDGWSLGVFLKELSALYLAKRNGCEPSLPPLPVQYPDYAVWQRERMQGENFASQLDYWTEHLKGAPPFLDLPTDRPRNFETGDAAGSHEFDLSEALPALDAFNRQHAATMFMTMLSAFTGLLRYLSGTADLVVGADVANRPRSEFEPLIGFFINLVALRIKLDDDPSFSRIVTQVREVTLSAYDHQEFPFDKLVEELRPERSPLHASIFQVKMVFHNVPLTELDIPGLQFEVIPFDVPRTELDLVLHIYERPQGLRAIFEYREGLFDAATISRFAELFRLLLHRVLSEPGIGLNALVEFLAKSDRAFRGAVRAEQLRGQLDQLRSAKRRSLQLNNEQVEASRSPTFVRER
ncbi:hypothetical protein CU048_08810 [Beijerinckiaceae bacterium]|nr:hypothetical protein CU048_08810 [Beijerinckiaceae bacterium]